MEIIRLTRDPHSSASDLAAVLTQDPVLATRILLIANSPAYGLSHVVSNIDRATALLGLKAVKMMALSFSLASDVGTEAGALSLETYWYHSLLNGVTARRWAELILPELAEEAFLAGLLSHPGRLVLAKEKAGDFAKVLAASRTAWPTHKDEFDHFGFTSAEVTAVLLQSWGLPEVIVKGTASMYRDHEPSPDVNSVAELAKVLENVRITEEALSGHAGPEAVEKLLAAVSAAGLGGDDVDEFVVDLETRVRDVAKMFDVAVPGEMSHQTLLNEARTRLVEVSLQAMQNLEVAQHEAEELRESNEQLVGQAFEDRLTGVPNRAAFDDYLERVVAEAVRNGGETVGVILFDIDLFKTFNDTYGHQIGDDVLRAVASAMKNVSRGGELFARYGGEEFVLVAHKCSAADLFVTGERLREAVQATRVPTAEHGELSVTVSGGACVAEAYDRGAGTRLIKLADDALYHSKEAGRNRISVA
jgi:diguanylate cyclase (GGDEF)-like protein